MHPLWAILRRIVGVMTYREQKAASQGSCLGHVVPASADCIDGKRVLALSSSRGKRKEKERREV